MAREKQLGNIWKAADLPDSKQKVLKDAPCKIFKVQRLKSNEKKNEPIPCRIKGLQKKKDKKGLVDNNQRLKLYIIMIRRVFLRKAVESFN